MREKKKAPRITRDVLKRKKAGCTLCRHHEINENGIGVCYATFSQGQSSRGARNEDKYCGMSGKKWQPIIKTDVPRGHTESETIEASTESQELSPQQRGALKRKANAEAKKKGSVGEGS
jgi:hypothetical protein